MRERLLAVLKLALAILLIPFVIGVTASFWQSLRLTDGSVLSAFGWGVVVYLILHILLYQPAQVFDTGKKMAEQALGFFSPLFKVAGYCIPIFTVFVFLLYLVAVRIWPQVRAYFACFVFAAAFTLTLHMVFTANALKGKQAGWLKENYFFSIFVIYIVNMMIVAGAFTLLHGDFSFVDFIRASGEKAGAT